MSLPLLQVMEATEKEWEAFREERISGIEEIKLLRQRVAEEEARQRKEREANKEEGGDERIEEDREAEEVKEPDSAMEIDEAPRHESEGPKEDSRELERKDEPAVMQADDEDAVEY